MEKVKAYRIDELRENIYLLAIQMEESGQKDWANILYQTRFYLLELERIKENKNETNNIKND